MSSDKKETNTFFLNAALGFLSLLLIFLLIALGTRIVYPRIQNERSEETPELIGTIIQLEVLNGCGVPGLANEFTSVLRQNGFDVVETGNFENFDIQETMIIARTFQDDNARRVADALGVSEDRIVVEASDDFYLDVTIVIGSDYQSLNLN